MPAKTSTRPKPAEQPKKRAAKAAPAKPPKPKRKRGEATLNVRRERFCEFVAAGMSQTDAYLEAGYKTTPRAARNHASRMMASGSVKARIAQLRATQTKQSLLTRDRKREICLELAEDAAQKTQDRLRAIELDAKLAGHFEPDRTEIEIGPKSLLSIRERAAQVSDTLAARYTTP